MDKAPHYWVKLSDSVVDTLIMNALEVFCLGDGRKTTELETFGCMLGFQKKESHTVYIHVERIIQNISAKRRTDSVTPNPKALHLLHAITQRILPTYMLVGDFHTHPYPNIKDVEAVKGYNFSRSDMQFFVADQDYRNLLWEESNQAPIMIVVTVTKLRRVHEKTLLDIKAGNLWTFDLGEYRFWFIAGIGYLDSAKKRQFSYSDKHVSLDLFPRGFNHRGDRLIASAKTKK